jgi:hypothetical protein
MCSTRCLASRPGAPGQRLSFEVRPVESQLRSANRRSLGSRTGASSPMCGDWLEAHPRQHPKIRGSSQSEATDENSRAAALQTVRQMPGTNSRHPAFGTHAIATQKSHRRCYCDEFSFRWNGSLHPPDHPHQATGDGADDRSKGPHALLGHFFLDRYI